MPKPPKKPSHLSADVAPKRRKPATPLPVTEETVETNPTPVVEPKAAPKPKAVAKPKPVAEAAPVTESVPEPESKPVAEPIVESNPVAESMVPEPETNPVAEVESAPQTEPVVEPKPVVEPEAKREVEAKPVHEAKPADESKPAPFVRKVREHKSAPDKPFTENKPKSSEEPEVMLSFAELGLDEAIYKAVSAMGFETPTPIQAKAIPVLISGRDLIGLAQTGTGKTAAFALPMIQSVDASRNETQALVLAPTRELAVQVAGGIHEFSKNTSLRVVPVYGGQPIDRQFRSLRAGAHIVVGTPGRVLDHLRRGSLSIANVSFCVLDEADEMLALGFAEDLEAILAELPEKRQVAFFSATMPSRILSITKKFLNDPAHVTIKSKQRTLDTTNQTYYEVPKGKKLEALARVLDMETPGPTIVFCRTRQETNDLSENLRVRGYNTESLHGDMNQAERDRVMRRFREGQADILVATDVAARGLDIETVTHVINYDIPWDVEQYIHRIGRTGRAGRSGDAITLVSGRERAQLKNIERMIGSTIKPARIPTAADIAARRRAQFQESLREVLQGNDYESHLAAVGELAEEFETAEVAAAALYMLWQSQHTAKDEVAEDMAHDFEQPELGMTRIFIGMGRQDGLRPGDLVGAITNEAGIIGKSIGVIDILDRTSFVEVPSSQAENVIEALTRGKIRSRKVKVQLARAGEGQEEAPRENNNNNNGGNYQGNYGRKPFRRKSGR